MQEVSYVTFSGVFSLREGVSDKEFFPALHAFYSHLVDMGFATGYHIFKREPLEGFGKTLPNFTYRGGLIYETKEQESAAYEYVKKNEEPVRSLHHAMNSKVARDADFFLETCIASG